MEGIGGHSVYGMIVSHKDQQQGKYLPISLITENSVVKEDIKKDTILTYDMVDLEETILLKMRREQDLKELGGEHE